MPSCLQVLTAYFLSGAAGLLYEVVWARLLALHLGQTVAAVSTVLAAFMGGLAVGAVAAGRIAARLPRRTALRWYARVELAIAATALAIAPALDGLTPLLAWAYRDGAGGAFFGLVRTLAALVLVTVPTTLMGATLPLVVRWFATTARRAGTEVGALYAANTAGAVGGGAAAGFWLVPSFGLARTTLVGVGANVAAAILAFAVAAPPAVEPSSERLRHPERQPPPRLRREAAPASGASVRPGLAAAILGLSGGAALALEVIWTRLLALTIGPTVYAFSAVLVCVIAGLALGSAVGARLARQGTRSGGWLAVALLLPAAVAVGAGWQLEALSVTVARLVATPGATFEAVARTEGLLVAVLLLPMNLGFGAAFPLAVALAVNRDERVAPDASLIYSVNTAGAIVGALGAGFVALPVIGTQGALQATAFVTLGSALLAGLAGCRGPGARVAVGVAAGTLATLAGAMPTWNRALVTGGGYKYAAYLQGTDLEANLEAGRLLYYADGAAATVTVREVAGSRSLAINGKVDASNAGDMVTQKLLAHLPLLLHPDPREVCIIGLGSGVTAGAALRHPIERVDVVEISPEVVQASRFFAAENHEALRDPRTRLLVGDGRTHLRLAESRYDVIVSEPSNPWMAGIASLFTREMFEAARRRLKPGGILCQWAHTYDISERDLRSIVATFATVFPHGTMWLVGEGDLLLLGSDTPLEHHLGRLRTAWERPGVRADLAEIEARRPFALLASFVGGAAALRAYAVGAPVQTDDHAPLEFSAPRSLYGATSDHAATLLASAHTPLPEELRRAFEAATAADWRDRGALHLKAEAYHRAFDDFARAVTLAPEDREALDGLVRAATGAGRQTDAAALLEELVGRHPNAIAPRLARSRLLAAAGAYAQAASAAQEALGVAPTDIEALVQLASVLADAQDREALAPIVARLEQLAPDRPVTAYYLATLRFLEGRFSEAAALAETVVARQPADHRAWNLLGAAYGNLGQSHRAHQAFLSALRANPRDPATHVNLGLFELQAAEPAAARAHFAEALTLDPRSRAALAGLADAFEQEGQARRARRIRSQLAELDDVP